MQRVVYQQPQQQQIVKQVGDYIYSENDILGKGSFGTVYQGKHHKTNQKVAVKVISKQFLKQNQHLEKYLIKEISAMKSLNSPHILKIHQYYETTNNHCLVLDYCDKGDLQNYLYKNNNNLPEKEAINIIRQISQGFKALKDQNFVHRDIKPENILISTGPNQQNIYQIADLGLVQQQNQSILQMETIVGTPVYMSPQVLKGEKYTSKSDIWSLGLMFYYILFGKFPWAVRNPLSLIKQIENVPLRFPLQKPISEDTKNFIQKCLQIQEKDRMSWDELFNHKLIVDQNCGNCENCAVDCISQKIDKKSKKIIKKLQDIIQTYDEGHQNDLIEKIFQKFDNDQNGTLDRNEFFQFLQKIDKTIKIEDSHKIYDIIDEDHQNALTLEQFFKLFNGYDFSDIGDVVSDLLNDIRAIVQHSKISLQQIFYKFDVYRCGTLCQVEFRKFVLSFAPKMSDNDISLIFQKFDTKKTGIINFQQFYDVLNFKHSCSQTCSSEQNNNQIQQNPQLVKKSSNNNNNINNNNLNAQVYQNDLINQMQRQIQQLQKENLELKQQNKEQLDIIESLKGQVQSKSGVIEYLEKKMSTQ